MLIEMRKGLDKRIDYRGVYPLLKRHLKTKKYDTRFVVIIKFRKKKKKT